jgi:hypothetical protein
LNIVTNTNIINYNSIAASGDVGFISGISPGVSTSIVIAPYNTGPSGLRMDNFGRFSIAKQSALYLLDVNGDIRVGTTTDANIRLCSSGIATTQAAYISSSTTNNNMVIMNQQVGNFFLGTYGNIRATVSSNGNVGIGTVTPLYTLDVSGIIRATGNVSIGGTLRPGYLLDVSGIAHFQKIAVGTNPTSGNTLAGISGNTNQGFDVLLFSSGGWIRFRPNGEASATGEGYLTNTGQMNAQSFNALSDYRYKNNVQPIMITRTVDLLKPIEYDISGTNIHDMGFLAHEVEEQFPFLVFGEKDGPEKQSLNYNGFIALLVKEIQELKRENKAIKERLNLLECKGIR